MLEKNQHNSTVKCFHVYKEIWNLVKEEVMDTRMEPENPTNKYTLCLENNGKVVGHLTKENNGHFSKMIFFFLRADKYESCQNKLKRLTYM